MPFLLMLTRLAALHLQDAMRLYDAIATRVVQPRLTDIELRLWLAGQGCSSGEAGRVMKLLRSLVMNDADAPYVSAWEWSVGWTWVMHALEVYGVEWRVWHGGVGSK
jgi:hypothetical protein